MPLFKQSILIQALVILLAVVALWWRAIVSPMPMPEPQAGAVLYGVLYGWLSGTPHLAAIIGMLLVIIGGVALNVVLVNHNLSNQSALLPTLLYIICMSAQGTTLTPMVIVSLLMVCCMGELTIKGPLLTIPPERACAATALIGLCSMFYLPSALLILSYMLVAINYSLYSGRDWAVMILGFLAPYILLATVLMFTDGLGDWWQGVADAVANVHFQTTAVSPLKAVGCIVLAAALVSGLVVVWRRSSDSTMLWQKNALTLISTLPGGLAILAVTCLFPIDMQLFALPFSFAVGCLLMPSPRTSTLGTRRKREWINTVILILIFIAALVC